MKVVQIRDEYKEDAKAMLEECISEEFDAVVVVGMWRDKSSFKIKASKVPDRLMLIGAIEEAKNHVLNGGWV